MFNFKILLEAAIISAVVYGFVKLIIALWEKVHIWVKLGKGDKLYDLANIKGGKAEGEGFDIRLTADRTKSVGKLAVKDEQCWLFLPKSADFISSDKAKYSEIGYVDTDGFVFLARKGQKPERIGFLAKPSKPNEPTIKGERTWKDCWWHSRLNVYLGDPDGTAPRETPENTPDKKSDGPDQGVGTPLMNTQPQADLPSLEEAKALTDGVKSVLPLSFAAKPRKKPEVEEVPSQEEVSVAEAPAVETEPVTEPEPVAEPAPVADPEPDPTPVILGPDRESPEEEPVPEPEQIIEPEPAEEPEPMEDPVEEPAEEEAPGEEPEPGQEPEDEPEPEQEPETESEEAPVAEPEPVVTRHEPEPEPVVSYVVDQTEEAYLKSVKEKYASVIAEILQEMIKVEGGTFMMGSDEDAGNEGPVHKVTLSTYCIGQYPIRQRYWNAIMGYNHSEQKNDDYPIAPVDWNESMLFINRLNALTGLKFSLPTEAQWEFAARGGNMSHGYLYSGSNSKDAVAWDGVCSPVGKKKPNELGIYDMSGLVREWCSDWYTLRYSPEEQFDPQGPPMPEDPEERKRVIRSPYGNDTVTNRKGELAENPKEFKTYGLRIACVPDNSLGRKEKPVLVGQSVKTGFIGGSSKLCPIPDEAQAAVFALFYNKYGKNKYKEFLGASPYGWADTALLSSLVFSILFLIVYFVNITIFQMPLLGNDKRAIPVMTAFYFVIWAIVRSIKIERAENGKSIQPVLDLMNKSVGHRSLDLIVIGLGYLSAVWTYLLFDADLIPLILAIAIGFTINKFARRTSEPWAVIDPLSKDDSSDAIEIEPGEEAEETLLTLPENNDTRRDFNWKLDSFSGKQLKAHIAVYFSPKEISSQRLKNPFFLEKPDLKPSDYKNYVERMKKLVLENETFNLHTRYILQEIRRISTKNELDELDSLQFILDFIQESLRYELDEESRDIINPKEYIRFPDELLFDQCGDCDCKTFLAATMYYYLGYDVLMLMSRSLGHAAVAISIKGKDTESHIGKDSLEDSTIEINGQRYYYCETTTDGFLIGDLPEGGTVDSFETRIEWKHKEDEEE